VSARRLIAWRHGQTAHNLGGRIQGQIDIPLDATGRDQAARAAQALAAARPAVIVASDLLRAQATAQALAEVTGVPVRLDARLRERAFGEWEGLTADAVREGWPEQFAAWRRGRDVPSVGMETRAAAAARYAECAAEAAAKADDGASVVIVAHGGVSACGLTQLLGLDPVAWQGLRVMANAHWAVLEASDQGPAGWRLAGYDLGAAAGTEELSGWF
jgi:probable phosphoglycerate mutase